MQVAGEAKGWISEEGEKKLQGKKKLSWLIQQCEILSLRHCTIVSLLESLKGMLLLTINQYCLRFNDLRVEQATVALGAHSERGAW